MELPDEAVVTLDEAHELRAGDQLMGDDEEPRVVLDQLYPTFESSWPDSQWRLSVLNLETGKKEHWPNGRLDELERVT